MSGAVQTTLDLDLHPAFTGLNDLVTTRPGGRVVALRGLVMEATGPAVAVGAVCDVEVVNGASIRAEVVGARDGRVLLMALGELSGVGLGSRIVLRRTTPLVAVGPRLVGRVIDALGRPLDGRGPVRSPGRMPLAGAPTPNRERAPITQPLDVGVRALNALLTCGRGQRVGLLAEAGVATSGLVAMAARHGRASVNVIALVGIRHEAVRRFLATELGQQGLARSVVVLVNAAEPAPVRVRGALLATAIAEAFRDDGHDVLLVVDSIAAVVRAQTEIGLATGEVAILAGDTPSSSSLLSRLLQRAGVGVRGTITGFYAVRADDDPTGAVADGVRATAEGEVVLARRFAAAGQVPPIDVTRSRSDVMSRVTDRAQQDAAEHVRAWMAAEVADRQAAITTFLRQPFDTPASLEASAAALAALVRAA
jgi:flagellum-specific ATP synthase